MSLYSSKVINILKLFFIIIFNIVNLSIIIKIIFSIKLKLFLYF